MLTANRAGCALALTFAALYSLCSLFFVVWPQGYMTTTAMLFHGFELSPAPHAMSFVGFILGVLCIAILGYIVGAVYAVIWNALSGDHKTLQASRPVRR